MIGVITTFYGYRRGNLIGKVKNLIEVFKSINLPPFIQLFSSPEAETFDKVVTRLKELRKKYGVKYSVHQSVWLPDPDFFLNLGSSDKEAREKTLQSLKKSIDFAREIEAKNVSFHPGIAADKIFQEEEFEPFEVEDPISYKEAYSNARMGLEELLGYAGGDIEISIENLNWRAKNRYLFCQPGDFKQLPAGVGVLFDTGHAYFSQQTSGDPLFIEKMIEATVGKITELHVTDNNGLEDEHKLPGWGSIPFSDIFQQISEKQKLPPIIIEASQKKHNYSDQDLKKVLNFYKRYA